MTHASDSMRFLTLADVVTAVIDLPEADGLVARDAVLDILQGFAYSLATEELAAVLERYKPPIGYWCCAFDWNRGLFRTSSCIERTAGDDPTWERIVAGTDKSAIEALIDLRAREDADRHPPVVIADGTRGMERGR